MSHLKTKHRKALEEFADCKISLEELRSCLLGVLEFDFSDQERRLATHYGTPEPGIPIEIRHIRNAMDKHAHGEITTNQLSDWAAMLMLNDAYDWHGPGENEISSWLHEISLLSLKPNTDEQA